jgi:hypothetical protein
LHLGFRFVVDRKCAQNARFENRRALTAILAVDYSARVTSTGMPIFNRPSGLATSSFTAYTSVVRVSLVKMVFGVNSASEEIHLIRAGNSVPDRLL